MALVVTIAGVNRTAIVEEDSIRITQLADSFTFTAELSIFDENSNVSITAGSHKVADEITLVDGATTFFGGYVANQDIETAEDGSRHLALQCHGYGILLNEVYVEYEDYFATADDAIIDDLFDTYLAVIDSVTHVAQIDNSLSISFTEMTLVECLNALCQRTQGRWYVDNEKKLHYFADEGVDAGFKLSDEPNGVTSFSYHVRAEKKIDAAAIVNRVRVIGADDYSVVRNDAASQALYGIRAAIVVDHVLTTTTMMNERGDGVLDKNKDPRITYIVRTFHDGAMAGNEIDFRCLDLGYNSIDDGDDPLVIREMTIYWAQGRPVYEMTLGSHADISAITRASYTADSIRKVVVSPNIPLASLGWGHDLVFSATDYRVVAWEAGDLTLSGGVGSYGIDAGNTGNMAAVTYIYLDVDVSPNVLQKTTTAANAIGARKILICVAAPVANEDTNKAIFQVFGGEGTGVLVTADNIAANTISANEMAVNSIVAAAIAANAVTADKIIAGAVTTAKIAAQAVTAVKLSIGTTFFNEADGLLLLNPPAKLTQEGTGAATANYVYSKRGGKLQIGAAAAAAGSRGSLHFEHGRWPGTQAFVIEEAGVNYCINPLMYDGNTDGQADNWLYWDDLGSGSDVTLTVIDHPEAGKGWLQRAVYTGVAGDVNDTVSIYHRTPAASFAATEDCTFTITYKGAWSGVVPRMYLYAENAGNGFLGNVNVVLTASPTYTRVSLTYTNLPANTDHVDIQIQIAGVDNGDTLDITFGEINVEKTDYPTTLIHGNAGDGYSWSGTANASTSSRTASYILLDDYVALVTDNNTMSFRIVAQMPYDYDATWSQTGAGNAAWDFRGADNNNRVLVVYDDIDNRFEVYINGVFRLLGTGVTFSAGDWLDIIVTLDFTADDYNLYINGVLLDNDTTALVAPTAVVDWAVGTDFAQSVQGGFAIAEYAVFDRVVTAEEVAQLYNLQRPLIDTGSQERPGIYILDGQFRIQSSQTGNRIQIDADEIAGYNGAGAKQFYLRASDGKAMAGGGVVALDADGIDIAVTTSEQAVRAYKFNSAGVNIGGLYGFQTAGGQWLRLQALEIAGKTAYIDIQAFAPATYEAQAFIRAKSGATDVTLSVKADSNAPTPGFGMISGASWFNFASCDVRAQSISTNAGTNKWKFLGHHAHLPGAIKGVLEIDVDGATYYLAELFHA